MRQSGPLETVAIVYSQHELAVILSFLDNHDIWTAPFHYHQISVSWPMTLALGGVPVVVRLEDADAARSALSAVGRSWFGRGVFTDNRVLDIAIVLLMMVAFFVPPPARLPAFVVAGRSAAEGWS